MTATARPTSYTLAFPYPLYQLLRKQNHSVEDIFAFHELPNITINANGTPELAKVELVSGNSYTQLQLTPQLGTVANRTGG